MMIWYPRLYQKHELIWDDFVVDKVSGIQIPVFSAEPLKDSILRLFGTVTQKRFPIVPGAFVPCAGKHLCMKGPKHLYAAIGIGIAKDRAKNACLFMEDIGHFEPMSNLGEADFGHRKEQYPKMHRAKVLGDLANSITDIGLNQNVEFSEIFVDIIDVVIMENQVGSVLVAAPYFSLAKRSVINNNSSYIQQDLLKWEDAVRKYFIYSAKD